MATGANVSGVVRAPIKEVWDRFRKFGPETTSWWPIYEWLKLDAPGVDAVGCVRSFRSDTGRDYKERLVTRDDATYKLQYELVSVVPAVPTLQTIMTTVEMQEKGPNETMVHWTSDVQVGSVFGGLVISTQEKTYRNAIDSLDKSFNPSLGTLEIVVLSAAGLAKRGLFAPDPYVVADLDRHGVKMSACATRTYNPTFNQTLSFDILSLEGDLRLSVFDARTIGHDEFLGSTLLDIHTLKAGQSETMKLKLDEVPSGELTVQLTLRLHAGDHLAHTAAFERQFQAEHLLTVLGAFKDQAMAVVTDISQDDPPRYEYTRYPRDPNFPDWPFEDLPKMVKGYPVGQLLPPHRLGLVTERAAEYVYSQAQFVKRLSDESADRWRAIYGGWVHPPERVIANWTTDVEFCRQLLAGVNPMVIASLKDPARIPVAMRGLTAEGQTAEQLATAGRLFALDYDELVEIPRYRDMILYAPVALVYLATLPDGTKRLDMLGFQLERGDAAEVFTAAGTPKLRYQLAKLHLACADNQYHQFIYHLGFAHLAMEPAAIAHHNVFPKDHPIGALLAPHFRDTIGINTLARQTLVSPVIPFTDRTFSPGTTGAMKLFLAAWRKWDFFGVSFPEQLKARGFDEAGTDGVPDYHFRDDGFKIWNALMAYVGDVVAAAYADDAAVAADPVLQAWCQESTDPERAAIPGFPATIASRELLTRSLVTIIFTCSAQHSAVNFSQFEYLSYVPNRPDSLFAEMPADRGEVTPEQFQSALPGMTIAQFQVMFAHLLTSPSEHRLQDLEGARDLFPAIQAKHAERLKALSAELEARDQASVQAGGAAYPYLRPNQIAQSIDI